MLYEQNRNGANHPLCNMCSDETHRAAPRGPMGSEPILRQPSSKPRRTRFTLSQHGLSQHGYGLVFLLWLLFLCMMQLFSLSTKSLHSQHLMAKPCQPIADVPSSAPCSHGQPCPRNAMLPHRVCMLMGGGPVKGLPSSVSLSLSFGGRPSGFRNARPVEGGGPSNDQGHERCRIEVGCCLDQRFAQQRVDLAARQEAVRGPYGVRDALGRIRRQAFTSSGNSV